MRTSPSLADVTERSGAAGPAESPWTTVIDDAPVALAVTAAVGPRDPAVAVVGADGLVAILTRAGDVVTTRAVPGGVLTAAWSPDGAVLAVGGPQGAQRWTAEDGLVPLRAGGWCQALAWSPAGQLAVADDRTAAVFAAGPQTRPSHSAWVERSWCTPEVASTVTALVWLRDGRELAVAGYGGVRAFSGARLARELDYAGSLLSMAASPDGRWLVSGNQDASVHVWRLRDRSELEMSGYPSKVTQVTFDASGRWLATNGASVTTVWDFSGRGPGGRAARILAAHPEGPTALAWHPRLPLLATAGADGTLALFDVPAMALGRPGAPYRSLVAADDESISALAWLDERCVVVATRSGTVSSMSCV